MTEVIPAGAGQYELVRVGPRKQPVNGSDRTTPFGAVKEHDNWCGENVDAQYPLAQVHLHGYHELSASRF